MLATLTIQTEKPIMDSGGARQALVKMYSGLRQEARLPIRRVYMAQLMLLSLLDCSTSAGFDILSLVATGIARATVWRV